jgi:hypothetical protein
VDHDADVEVELEGGRGGARRPPAGAGECAPAHAQRTGTAADRLKDKVNPGTPCCAITAVDQRTGVVTARVNATGATYQFTLADRSALAGLRVGQAIAGVSCAASAGGTTKCGNNSPRDADTRPKECTTTDSAGREIKVVCPPGTIRRD